MTHMKSTTSNWNFEYVAARIVFLIFKFMGLAPFSVRRTVRSTLSKKNISQDSSMIQFTPSRFGYAYNCLLIPLLLYVLVNAVPYAFKKQYSKRPSQLTTSIELTVCAMGYAVLFMIWLMLGLRQKKTVRLINRILSLDGETFCLNGNSLPECRSFILIVCITNSIMITGLLLTSYLSYGLVVTETIMLGIPTIICSWFIAQYVFVVKLIENRFKAINQTLLDFLIPTTFNSRDHLSIARELTLTKISKPDIATLRRTHANCCDIAMDMSALYSIPILLTIVYSCYGLINSGYFIVVPFMVKIPNYVIMMRVSSLFWIACRLLPVAVLAASVTDVTKETRKTSDVVKNLLAHPNNRNNITELKQFLLELLHRNVKFTACGLFPLDCTLVLSIVGMVITYLIIFVQFRVANAGKDLKHRLQNSTNSLFNDSRVE